MLTPKFCLNKDRTIYVTEEWISDGIWILSKDILHPSVCPKAINNFVFLKPGSYNYKGQSEEGKIPDFQSLLNPIRNNQRSYYPTSNMPIGVQFSADEMSIHAYRYQFAESLEIGIAPEYASLLRLGNAFAHSSNEALILTSGDKNSDLLVGAIMPIRVSGGKIK